MVSGAGGCGGRCPCPDPGVCKPAIAGVAWAAPIAASPAAPICSSSRRASRRGSPALSSCSISMSPGSGMDCTRKPRSRGRISAVTLRTVLRCVVAFTFLGLLIAAPAGAFVGQVIDARRRAPIANAEVTVVGHRGSVRTGRDGRFEWALRAAPPLVFVVILQDGLVCGPIHVTTLDEATRLTLVVEAAIAESVDVSGTAPAIDVSAGASTSLVTAADITPSASDHGRRDSREHTGRQHHLRRPVSDAGDSWPGPRADVHHRRRQPCVERAARGTQRFVSRPGHR